MRCINKNGGMTMFRRVGPPMGPENAMRIREIFAERTGVALPGRRRRPVGTVLVVAAALVCLLSLAVGAVSRFSSPLEGDELALTARYLGEGLVEVTVENRSDRELVLQQEAKLMRWSTGEEVKPGTRVAVDCEPVPARGTATAVVDLSEDFDVAALEEPMAGDWYYLLLTNADFISGHDWMCSLDLSGEAEEPPAELPPVEVEPVADVESALAFYFEVYPQPGTSERQELEAQYAQAVEELLAERPAAPALTPTVLRVDAAAPYDQQCTMNVLSADGYYKRLGGPGEQCLTISALVPQARYDSFAAVPLLHLFVYNQADIAAGEVFLRGRFYTAEELEPCLVYQDETYVCYEVSSLAYSDLDDYLTTWAQQNPIARWDEESKAQVLALYGYFKENLPDLISPREP